MALARHDVDVSGHAGTVMWGGAGVKGDCAVDVASLEGLCPPPLRHPRAQRGDPCRSIWVG